jgi:hypothetical protein
MALMTRHRRWWQAAKTAGWANQLGQEREQPLEGDRLLQHAELGIAPEELTIVPIGIGGHERNLERRLDLTGALRQLPAVHHWHDQVRNQEPHFIRVLLQVSKRVPAILRRLDRVAHVAAYAFAELFGWQQGIDEHFSRAPAFYMVVGTAITAGVALDFGNVNPVKALYWTAIINGLLAPFLLTGILLVASDRPLMQKQPSSRLSLVTVGVTTALMFAAAVAMFVM